MTLARRLVLAAAVGLTLAACGSDSAAPSLPLANPSVSIDPGLSPRMTPTQVGGLVLDQIHQMERSVGHAVQPARLVSITATSAAGVERLEPKSGHGVPQRPGIEWLVRGEGTFTNARVPPGGQPMVAGTGYFIIQDSDGSIVGFGFP